MQPSYLAGHDGWPSASVGGIGRTLPASVRDRPERSFHDRFGMKAGRGREPPVQGCLPAETPHDRGECDHLSQEVTVVAQPGRRCIYLFVLRMRH